MIDASTVSTNAVMEEVVRAVCETRGIAVESFCQGWVLRLSRGEGEARDVRFTYGFSLGLNSASAHQLATDKSATAGVLARERIPVVAHELFLHPSMNAYVGPDGNGPRLKAAFEQWGGDVVVKDNTGTGGDGVFRCRTLRELEQRSAQLFQRVRSVAVCPFVDIQRELRFIVLGDRCEVVYRKDRPAIRGDGTRTVHALLTEAMGGAGVRVRGTPAEIVDRLEDVLPAGQELLLDWRHNIGRGALPVLVEGESEAESLALRAAAVVGVRFGSVDVVETGSGLAVLEINSGVMMEGLAQVHPKGREIAERVYGRAVAMLFE